jgi:hypothetical protein
MFQTDATEKVYYILYPVNFFVTVIILDIIKKSKSYTVISSFRKYRNSNRTSMSEQIDSIYVLSLVNIKFI